MPPCNLLNQAWSLVRDLRLSRLFRGVSSKIRVLSPLYFSQEIEWCFYFSFYYVELIANSLGTAFWT